MTVINKKNNAQYEVVEEYVVDATSGTNNGRELVLYKSLDNSLYVRERKEFIEVFKFLNGNPITDDDI